MQSAELYDVIITGCGPVGATLANLLVQQGLSVAVVEREAAVFPLARAGHFDAEVMRVFQSIGVASEVEAATDVTLGMRFLDADGAMLMEWRRGGEKGPNGWISDYMFFQPAVERILRARLAASPKVRMFLSHDVFAVRDVGDHAEVQAENIAEAKLVTFRGKYVVGCDGARSLVRRTIGAEHENLGFKQRWLVIDVLQKHDLGLERISTQHCNPERPMYATCIANGMLRWEIMLKPEDDAAYVTTHDAIWNFIESSVRPISRHDGEIHRGVVYTFESLITETWRKGRLMVAGDSAHRTPPFLGQGMCAGIRDASNLAWKIAAVCNGVASDSLLDTYESERRPHVKTFIEGAVEVGKFVQMDDRVKMAEIVRDMRANPKAYAPPNPPLGPGLNRDHGSALLGRQVVQPQVHGQLLDEHIGHAFAVIATESFATSEAAFSRLKSTHPTVKFIEVPEEVAAFLEPYGSPAIVVRPDRYVHAALANGTELARVLDGLPVLKVS